MSLLQVNKMTHYFGGLRAVQDVTFTVRVDNTDITGKDSLAGKTIGVQLGTTGDIESQKITGATVKNYDDIGLAFQDLMNGQIDAVVADNPLALGYVGQNPDKLKTAGPVC